MEKTQKRIRYWSRLSTSTKVCPTRTSVYPSHMQNSATNIKLEKVFKVKGTPKGNINKKVNKKREQEETPKTE